MNHTDISLNQLGDRFEDICVFHNEDDLSGCGAQHPDFVPHQLERHVLQSRNYELKTQPGAPSASHTLVIHTLVHSSEATRPWINCVCASVCVAYLLLKDCGLYPTLQQLNAGLKQLTALQIPGTGEATRARTHTHTHTHTPKYTKTSEWEIHWPLHVFPNGYSPLPIQPPSALLPAEGCDPLQCHGCTVHVFFISCALGTQSTLFMCSPSNQVHSGDG